MTVPQERKLVTEIPGPKSLELHARTKAAVSAGVGVTLPAYIERAAGGILVDVDGNNQLVSGGLRCVDLVHLSPGRVGTHAERSLDSGFQKCISRSFVANEDQISVLDDVTSVKARLRSI